MDVTVVCDRCKSEIQGLEFTGPLGGTAGFYRTTSLPWSKYVDEGEKVICDSCMQSDPRYRADYPVVES